MHRYLMLLELSSLSATTDSDFESVHDSKLGEHPQTCLETPKVCKSPNTFFRLSLMQPTYEQIAVCTQIHTGHGERFWKLCIIYLL